MRHVQITHIYVLPVPADDLDAFDAIVGRGVDIMEGFIKSRARNIRDLRSDWQMMPKEYSRTIPQVEGTDDVAISRGRAPSRYMDTGLTPEEQEQDRLRSLEIIEADADAGISFVSDVMGERFAVQHPWEQGLYIFPEGHPMREIEEELKRRHDDESLEHLHALAPKLKELPSGE